MWVLPLAASVVALVFAVLLGRRFLRRRRSFEALWALALLMYAAASFMVVLGMLGDWTPFEFRTYWLLGAVLNVPFLAAGEIDLLFRRSWVLPAMVLVLVLVTGYSLAVVRTAEVAVEKLSEQLPSGKEVFGAGTSAHRLAQYFSYPAYAVLLGGTLWSAWKMRGRPELRDRFNGTLWIAIGATVVAGGGSAFAAFGVPWGFALTLLAGISLMFWGFLLASGRAEERGPTQAV
jgi:hypothetical protein